MKNEIILYSQNDPVEHIEVRLEDDTVWLNRNQLVLLFGRDVKTIGKHINNVFLEGELNEKGTVAKFATVQLEGNRKIERDIEYYNLDVIISVGYRIKSKQGTQFRIWANQILRDYLLKGYSLNQRMNRIEDNLENLSKKVDKIDFHIQSQLIPTQGVFFDGQVFNAYELTSRIIRSAKTDIILIDNYIDESTFTHLSKKCENVTVSIFTKNCGKQVLLDIKKANEQFGDFKMVNFSQSHDRFLIIDQKDVYHLGASLKDLGKKWFAFSKMDKSTVELLLKEVTAKIA